MDRIDAMRAFVTVVNEGSFARAAERLDLSPQLVSKYVSQLERHLGSRLLNRTTRQVNVTEAGSGYFERAQQLLADVDEMENQLGDLQNDARGLLRISAPLSFATQHMSRLLCDFQAEYPSVRFDLQLNDRKVDIIEEGFDIALRIGHLKSSSLIAKRIAPVRLVICASAEYLRQHGTPKQPEDLQDHSYLHYSYMTDGTGIGSPETKPTKIRSLSSEFISNNGDVLVQAAIKGMGIVIQPTFIAGPAIAAGELEVILSDYEPEPMALYAVYANRQFLSTKVRCFIDFIDDYYGSPPYWDVL